jgi:hypothetical protein
MGVMIFSSPGLLKLYDTGELPCDLVGNFARNESPNRIGAVRIVDTRGADLTEHSDIMRARQVAIGVEPWTTGCLTVTFRFKYISLLFGWREDFMMLLYRSEEVTCVRLMMGYQNRHNIDSEKWRVLHKVGMRPNPEANGGDDEHSLFRS